MPEMPQILPIEPGYYANNIRNCSFGEFRRLGGGNLFTAALSYIFRSALPADFKEGHWLPQYWDDIASDSSELTQECLDALLPPLAELERLGFYLASYQRVRRHLYPTTMDNGGAFLLHSSGEFVAPVIWIKNRKPTPQSEELKLLTVAIGMSCVSGKVVTVLNSSLYLDPPPLRKIVALKDATVAVLWERAQKERQYLNTQGEQPRLIRLVEELKHTLNSEEERNWHDRINVRRVMVRMSNEQIEAALQRMTANR
ncbi:MAG: hypothetical protein QM758_25790 [Armatimonas sp.]